MAANKLYPVQVFCEIPQSYIEEAVKNVSATLSSQIEELNDFDEPMFNGKIRVCVEFEIEGFDTLAIKVAEILNSDWDLLPLESAIFKSKLEGVVSDFNRNYKEAIKQGCEIKEMQEF